MTQSGSAAFAPTYNAATNQYATLPAGTPSYSATGAINDDGSHSYSWDSENKSVQVDTVYMTYDAFGRWVERSAAAGYSQAVYAPDGSEFAVMSGASLVKSIFVAAVCLSAAYVAAFHLVGAIAFAGLLRDIGTGPVSYLSSILRVSAAALLLFTLFSVVVFAALRSPQRRLRKQIE